MPFPVSISFPPPRDLELVGPPNVRSSIRERPKGLWRGRVTNKPSNIPDRKEKSPHIISSDPDDDSAASSSGCPAHHYRPTKRLKTDSDSDSTDPDDDNVYYWDFARQRSAEPVDHHRLGEGSARNSRCRTSDVTRAKYIVVSSIARGASMDLQQQQSQQERTTCDLDDWELLKDLFARAAENYEGNDHPEALPLLRGVMHECHRFLTFYPDPSVLFTSSTPPPSPDEKYKGRMWSSSSSSGSKEFHRKDPKCTCFTELPTAFHALLGTALFLFGNIIAQEPSLALEGEPTSPIPYWLASLDVFETGENLPSRTSGDKPTDLPEDWRMAIVWGRSLVCLAEELVNRQSQAKDQGRDPTSVSLDIEEPKWPVESPFHAIAAQRQPITRRMTFNTATPNELLTLAMDQFSRGIFHMPHPQSASRLSPAVLTSSSSSANTSTQIPTLNPVSSPNVATTTSSFGAGPSASTSTSSTSTSSLFSLSGPGSDDSFSRAKQLYTIASEVLHIAEKLESTEERQHWANWADSVLNQMKMEATTAVDMDDVWRSGILRSRGRCRLIVGSAYAEEVEAAQERGEVGVLRREEAEDARSDLVLAIELFERARAKGQEKEKENETDSDRDIDEELTTLLTEALVTLANLTEDPKEREKLYARAKAEAGSDMDLDLDGEGEEEDDDDDDDDDVKMDESH
ncbi:hypothetical protein M378DRAFT_173068 [Amanita muscaria Koide BX008]|uniref:Uncharacterized protein n=1 Tax=Amanita muscaria (strain Koide BX008) TaxID=946122 RepID=A0A0C2S077_AMAMK|nr:hypothetical protein M378DRAFT_173068 [Amanita muscaria Koide BX008]